MLLSALLFALVSVGTVSSMNWGRDTITGFARNLLPRLGKVNENQVNENEVNASQIKHVVVIGCTGRTGRLIVSKLAKKGVIVHPCTHSLRRDNIALFDGCDQSDNIANVTILDVRTNKTFNETLAGADAVVFAATASKYGGTSEEVDFWGTQTPATLHYCHAPFTFLSYFPLLLSSRSINKQAL